MKLSGYRTYIIVALGITLSIADYNQWFLVPPVLKDSLMFAAIAFLRSGVANDAGRGTAV